MFVNGCSDHRAARRHELAALFPDGQLFVRLHGHTSRQKPVESAEVLATLLPCTGTAADEIALGHFTVANPTIMPR